MQRIALVITELFPGGAEKCCVQLACFLKQRDFDVAIYQLWPAPPTNKRHLVDILDAEKIPWKSGGAVRPGDFIRVTRWLKRELRQFQPEVVQSFLFHANLATAAAVRGIPCRFFGGARVRQPERWRQLAQRWAARRMEKLVCVSRSVEEHCRNVERIAEHRLTTIPNGIETLDLQPQQIGGDPALDVGIPPAAPVLLFVGRLVPQKGIVPLVERSDQLLEQLPQHHLVCVGEGPSRTKLEALKQASRFGKRLHFVGWQPNPLQWMRRCELLLLPAAYEGMPNVVLEAMSVGRPVVAFKVDGLEELLGTDSDAQKQLVAPEQFDSLIRTSINLAQSPAITQYLGRRNQARVEHAFRLDDQLAKYLSLYRTLEAPHA
jgi:glycosyltransferase involved in cell wall biosynthesis